MILSLNVDFLKQR